MICPRCGVEARPDATFCANCGASLNPGFAGGDPAERTLPEADPPSVPADAPWPGAARPELTSAPPMAPSLSGWEPVAPPPAVPFGAPKPVAPPAAALIYAGFWRRLWAAFLDGVVLWALSVPFIIMWLMPLTNVNMEQVEGLPSDQQMEIFGACLLYWLVTTLMEFLYFGLFESSRRRATLGRIALGIQVTDVHGNRIGLGRAFLRRIARILSVFTFGIGFLVSLFSKRRQTLHDLLAGTLVVRDPS
jgi:uncharacterized RDD family membrane protein YckC